MEISQFLKTSPGLHIVNLWFFKMFLVIEGNWAGDVVHVKSDILACSTEWLSTNHCYKRPKEQVFCKSGLMTSPKFLIKAGCICFRQYHLHFSNRGSYASAIQDVQRGIRETSGLATCWVCSICLCETPMCFLPWLSHMNLNEQNWFLNLGHTHFSHSE